MQDSDDLHHRRSPVHDHVLIHAEEQHIPAGEVGAFMAFAGNVGQAFEGIYQLSLNPVGDGWTRFSGVSRTGAILEPGCLIGCKTGTQFVPRYAFAPV